MFTLYFHVRKIMREKVLIFSPVNGENIQCFSTGQKLVAFDFIEKNKTTIHFLHMFVDFS